jgi:ATP-dependent RNA helicase DDX46/PRP5
VDVTPHPAATRDTTLARTDAATIDATIPGMTVAIDVVLEARSPAPRRDRSRDRLTDDRYRDDRHRANRDRDRGYDDRARESRRRDDRHGSYNGGDDRRRGSSSATPSSDVRRGHADKLSDSLSREEKEKLEKEKIAKDEEAAKKAKQARLEEWKKKQLEKKAKVEAEAAGVATSSPAMTAPPTPAAAATPPATVAKPEPSKVKLQRKSAAEKSKQIPKSTFRLDETAKAKPLLSKSAGMPVVSQDANNVLSKCSFPFE